MATWPPASSARARRALGLPAIAFGAGPISGVGYVADNLDLVRSGRQASSGAPYLLPAQDLSAAGISMLCVREP